MATHRLLLSILTVFIVTPSILLAEEKKSEDKQSGFFEGNMATSFFKQDFVAPASANKPTALGISQKDLEQAVTNSLGLQIKQLSKGAPTINAPSSSNNSKNRDF